MSLKRRSASSPQADKPGMQEDAEFDSCARRLKALADPERLKIVVRLFNGSSNVSDLASSLQDDIVRVSHHLGVLRHAGLVSTRREGRFVVYDLHPDVVNEARVNKDAIDLGCCRLEIPR